MDKRILKGLIDEKLEVIQEQFSIIRDYEAKIPMIEVDLLMTSIRDLYELVLNLQQENMGGVMPHPVVKQDEEVATPPPEQSIVETEGDDEIKADDDEIPAQFSSGILSMERVNDDEPEKEEVPDPVMPDPESREPETKMSEISDPPATEQKEQIASEPPEVESEPVVSETDAPASEVSQEQSPEKAQKLAADLFSEGAPNTLADRLKDGHEKLIADKLQEKIITDLRTTIGINDKFLFINELFEGNLKDYDEAVQKLNTSTTMAQTDLLLLDLKIDHKWDGDSPTVKKFVELVRKKF